jgi:hypothetical protein
MKQKVTFILLWGGVVVGGLLSGGRFGGAQVKQERKGASGEQPTSKVVERIGLEEAKAIAAAFVGEERAKGMRYLGRFLRKTFPPFVMCHRFEIPLGVNLPPEEVKIPDDNAPGRFKVVEVRPEKPLTAKVWVDEMGRVVTYDADFGYEEAKYRGKERPRESDLLSEARAVEIAKKVVELARVPMEGMRLVSFRLNKPQRDDRYYCYSGTWEKYVPVPGVGEVQFPTSILLEIDALTGELDLYLFKEFPVVVTLTPPKVSKERAIELARKICPLQEIQETEARLKIEPSNLPNWENEQEVELWREDPPRFYREYGMKRQALVWQVRFKGKYTPPPHLVAPGHVPQPRDAEWTGIVNATTGTARKW